MILTLDKDPATSTLFNSARQTCEEYMIFFYRSSFEKHVKCASANVEKEQHITQ